MAGDWIKMGAGLRRHPKVVRIASALHADRLRVVGALHAVWSVFDEHSVDGTLDGYSAEVMDEEIGWPGFCEAMESVRWIAQTDAGLAVPEYEEHNGPTAKRRALDTKRKAESRAESASSPDPVFDLSASDADRTTTREEKRREEKKENKEPTPSGVGRATKKCPASFVVTDELRKWAGEKVPAIDTEAETETFRDHTFKTAVTDWPGAWRNWMRKAAQFGPKPTRPQQTGETPWQRSQRERVAQMTGGLLSAKAPNETIDMDTRNVTPLRLG